MALAVVEKHVQTMRKRIRGQMKVGIQMKMEMKKVEMNMMRVKKINDLLLL